MLRSIKSFPSLPILLLVLLLSSCSPAVPATATPTGSAAETFVAEALTKFAPSPTPESTPAPDNYNPLTGLPVEDPALLQIPAVLLSISHFPVNARPQAGLSFAPYVFEIYITEGATRFLTTFYGQFPAPEVPVVGDCDVRREIFKQTGLLLGNRVWLDSNGNNLQDAWENGIGGICVNLYDTRGTFLQQTTTDSNGYYGFNVEAGKYIVQVQKPPKMEFVQRDAGEEENDSDIDPATGHTEVWDLSASRLDVDAGLTAPASVPDPMALPPAKVGPVRSGRMVYRHIAAFFPDSCLIYASASPEVLEHLPKCAFVEHDVQGGGYMLGIDDMIQHAKESKKRGHKIDYASNFYTTSPPQGGADAAKLNVYVAWLHQSAWVYDPLYQSWWRYVDDADQGTPGVLHPEIDRLNRRQLHFENVIVLFAKHEVISPTNLEIHMEEDLLGDALLFRDGKMYKIRWSTVPTKAERKSGQRKPLRFLDLDEKTPVPLKPGHTWIMVVTPETTVTEKLAGQWLLQFAQPEGAK